MHTICQFFCLIFSERLVLLKDAIKTVFFFSLAEIAINGKVKVMTAGGLVAGWAAGSAYIISRYIDDPVNMVLLVTGAIVPATVATGLAVKKIIDGSFQIIVEVYSLDALDELWKRLVKKIRIILI